MDVTPVPCRAKSALAQGMASHVEAVLRTACYQILASPEVGCERGKRVHDALVHLERCHVADRPARALLVPQIGLL